MKPFTKAAVHSQSQGVSQTQRVIGLENPFSKGYKYCRDGRLTRCPGTGPEGTGTCLRAEPWVTSSTGQTKWAQTGGQVPEEHKFQRQSNVSGHKSHKKQMTLRSQKGRPGQQGAAGNRSLSTSVALFHPRGLGSS